MVLGKISPCETGQPCHREVVQFGLIMPAELTIAFHGKTVIYAFIAIESMDLVAGVARITRLQKGMVILDCPITRFCGSGTVGRRRPYSITSKYRRSFRSSDHLSGCYSMTKHPIKTVFASNCDADGFRLSAHTPSRRKGKISPSSEKRRADCRKPDQNANQKVDFQQSDGNHSAQRYMSRSRPCIRGTHDRHLRTVHATTHALYPHVDTYRHTENDGKTVYRTRAAYRTSLQARMRNLQWSFLRLPR